LSTGENLSIIKIAEAVINPSFDRFFTPLQRGDSNLQQAKVTASAVSKLSHVSNNPYIKL